MTSNEELKMEVILKSYNDDDNIEFVYHFADIHIERTLRHNEQKAVLDETLITMQKGVDRGEKAIAVICGDIFDSKMKITPDACKIIQDFLGKIPMPVIVIAGNHDINLANIGETDALTASIGFGKKNIYYLRESGYYMFKNIWFGVYSLIDNKELDIKYLTKKVGKEGIKIALYHGALNGAKIENGLKITSNKSKRDFEGWDYVMLGDIHIYQYMDGEKRRMAYPGSLIIRNFGEPLKGHGIIRWDLENNKSKHIEIKNDYGFHTITVEKGKICSSLKELTRKPHIRLQYSDTSPEQMREIEYTFKNEYNAVEIKSMPMEIINTENREIMKLRTEEISNFLSSIILRKHFVSKYYKGGDLNEEMLAGIVKFHRKCRKEKIDTPPRHSLGRWRPIKLYFENMFCYKGSWSITFPNGLLGLFGKNGSGKSAIIDILFLAAYDYALRNGQKEKIITEGQNTCRIYLEFEKNGITYIVYRKGKIGKKGLELTMKLYKISEGKVIAVTDDKRADTNKILQELVGTHEKMELLNTILQSCEKRFVDGTPVERSGNFGEMIELHNFPTLRKHAKGYKLRYNSEKKAMIIQRGSAEGTEKTEEELKEIIVERKKIQKEKNENNRMYREYSQLNTEEVANFIKKVGKNGGEKRLLENEKELRNKYKNYDMSKINYNLEEIEILDKKIEISEKELVISMELEEKVKMNLITPNTGVELLKRMLKIGGKCDLLQKCKMGQELGERIERLRHEISIAENAKNDLIGHKYNKNCEYCCDNKIVKNAQKYKKELPSLIKELKILRDEYSSLGNASKKLEEYLKLEEQFNKENEQLVARSFTADFEWIKRDRKELSVNYISPKLEKMKNERRICIGKLKEKKRYEELLKENKMLTMMGEINFDELAKLAERSDKWDKKYEEIREKEIRLKEMINMRKNYDEEIRNKEEKYKIAALYEAAMGPKGIPLQLTETIVSEIGLQMNSILGEIALCRIRIDIIQTGPEIIFIKDKDGKDVNRSVAMGSGSEKLLVELALRAVMSQRMSQSADILILDESLKCLDEDRNASIGNLLKILNKYFKTIFIISHADIMQDLAQEISAIPLKEEDWREVLVKIRE